MVLTSLGSDQSEFLTYFFGTGLRYVREGGGNGRKGGKEGHIEREIVRDVKSLAANYMIGS